MTISSTTAKKRYAGDGATLAFATGFKFYANGDVGVTTGGWGDPNGFFQFSVFVPGQTKHFQIFHRDSGNCGNGQNTTQAVSVTFVP